VVATAGTILAGQLLPVYGVALERNGNHGSGKFKFVNGFTIFTNVEYLWGMDSILLKFLALVVFCFSLLWPHVKLASLIAVWFVPGEWVPTRVREQWLFWVNSATTYSLLDVYLVALLEVAVNIPLMDTKRGVEYAVQVVVRSGGYFYATGTVASLVAGHVVTHLEVSAAKERGVRGLEPPRLQARRRVLVHDRVPVWVQGFVGGLMAAAGLLFLVSEGVNAFEVSYNDDWEDILGHKIKSKRYSVLSMLSVLGSSGPKALGVYVALLFVSLLTVVFVGRFVGFMVLWYHPLPHKQREPVADVFDVFHAWSSIDVFLASLVIVALAIGVLSQHFLQKIVDMDHPIDITLLPGFYTLLVAQALMVVAHYTAAHFTKKVLAEQADLDEGTPLMVPGEDSD